MIVLSSGGTGGHVFPSIALANYLKKSHKVSLITDNRGIKFLQYDQNIFNSILSNNIRRKNILIYLLDMLIGIIKSIIFLKKNKAKLVVAFGGYPCFAGAVAAIILNIPLFLHEQNAIFGRANKVLVLFAKKVFTSFKHTLHSPKKSVYCGNFLSSNIANQIKIEKNINQKFNLVVLGGSQASKLISQTVCKTICSFDSEIIKKLTIIQQAPKNMLDEIKSEYKKLNIDHQVNDFFKNAIELIYNCDLLISRSGATTVAEVINLQAVSLFVPLAASKDGDQKFNALELFNKNACFLVEEKDFNHLFLADFLKKIIIDRAQLKSVKENLKKFQYPNAFAIFESSLKNVI